MHAQSRTVIAAGLFLLAAGLAVAQGTKEGTGGNDRKQLTGTWQATTVIVDGRKAPDVVPKDIRLVLDAEGKFQFQNTAQKRLAAGTVQIGPSARPRTMDFTYTEGELKGRTTPGIYESDGDTLRICTAAAGKARPTEFASKPGSHLALVTYKREKPGAAAEKK
jgi:uncharacterized protein (TIGR03067 family)